MIKLKDNEIDFSYTRSNVSPNRNENLSERLARISDELGDDLVNEYMDFIRGSDDLKEAGQLPAECQRRPVKYLNNIVEQDHRFIKRRVKPGLGFGSYPTAWRTIQGYETMNMIRKGQLEGTNKGDIKAQNQFIAGLFGVAA